MSVNGPIWVEVACESCKSKWAMTEKQLSSMGGNLLECCYCDSKPYPDVYVQCRDILKDIISVFKSKK